MKSLKKNLNVSAVDPSAKTIQISFDHYNPELTRDMTKAIMDVFFLYEEEISKKNTDKILAFVDTQLDSLAKLLKVSKDSITSFQKKSKLSNPDNTTVELSSRINSFKTRQLENEEELVTLYLIKSKITPNPDRIQIYKLIPEMLGKKNLEVNVIRQVEELNALLENKKTY